MGGSREHLPGTPWALAAGSAPAGSGGRLRLRDFGGPLFKACPIGYDIGDSPWCRSHAICREHIQAHFSNLSGNSGSRRARAMRAGQIHHTRRKLMKNLACFAVMLLLLVFAAPALAST